jgi:uncharacterized protein YpmS
MFRCHHSLLILSIDTNRTSRGYIISVWRWLHFIVGLYTVGIIIVLAVIIILNQSSTTTIIIDGKYHSYRNFAHSSTRSDGREGAQWMKREYSKQVSETKVKMNISAEHRFVTVSWHKIYTIDTVKNVRRNNH